MVPLAFLAVIVRFWLAPAACAPLPVITSFVAAPTVTVIVAVDVTLLSPILARTVLGVPTVVPVNVALYVPS